MAQIKKETKTKNIGKIRISVGGVKIREPHNYMPIS